MCKKQKWHCLLTTNLTLDFEQAFEIYATRWTIEVFFKECKQFLRLGKCEERSFEAQIAATTLCLLQYNMLRWSSDLNLTKLWAHCFDKAKQRLSN